MTANVEIYTWGACPFCIQAKALLNKKGVKYTEYRIDGDYETREKMKQRAEGRSSLPQIFINNQPIGGCDELYFLESTNKLDSLLNKTV
ncbi:glutaredoxin 3 [cyanobacterium endosymbiont of Rhopalodia gibberula]|uniref:glutaredoxin 3 n=1 Tax=cyanobacterium endosymbiont of Rhopalodia gibberula TaxID=1763363 RepID=UPI000DC6FE76|nr:glutaredoxin 3 [cyanobacterium endosymbiont of Rhopalodia gibberula]BBA78678.1 glutaredoxin 3 [cyanobacterium endosymbiont of Rhopalodia gibberula]